MNDNCSSILNYFSITKGNTKYLLENIKLILKKKNQDINEILIITDKGPYFGTKFINQIILFYAHILKIKVTLLYFGNYKEQIKNGINSNQLLNKILGYDLNCDYIYGNDVQHIKNKKFECIILNIQINKEKLEDLNILNLIYHEKCYLFSYRGKNTQSYIKMKFSHINFIQRHELNYWFFSKLLNNYYKKEIGFRDKKYDLFIAGSIKGRDFKLLNYLKKENPNFSICIITSLREEINKIQSIIGDFNNVDIIHNPNSYSQFLELAHNSKIILNNINTGLGADQGYGSTGLLAIMGGKHLILSKKTKFYKKYIIEGIDGFFYSNYEDCLKKINYILSLDKNIIENIMENRLHNFNNNKQIEDYCEQIFELK